MGFSCPSLNATLAQEVSLSTCHTTGFPPSRPAEPFPSRKQTPGIQGKFYQLAEILEVLF